MFEDAANDTSSRRLVNIETSSLNDQRNIYLLVRLFFAALQLGLHFGYTKNIRDAYIGGTHWIKERDDL